LNNRLHKPPIHILDSYSIPYHMDNIKRHLSYCIHKKETTLTLFTKDHKKVVKISDEDFSKLGIPESYNWEMYRKKEWQKELETLYKNMGD